MKAALYLIPVPLDDYRANGASYSKAIPEYNFEVIRSIKTFIVENEKSARRFLSHIPNSTVDSAEYFELSEHTKKEEIIHYLDALEKGEPIGVISEAGCPAVADPGADVVALAQKKNLTVVPLIGPSSIITAIMASGFNGQSFAFNGYLPVKEAERNSKIKALESRVYKENQTQIFIETPYRNAQLFESLLKNCRQETLICVASGITTDFEFIKTKTVAQWKKTGMPEFKKIPSLFLIYK